MMCGVTIQRHACLHAPALGQASVVQRQGMWQALEHVTLQEL